MSKVLKFQADWCGPCKLLTATLAHMVNKPEIESIDVDKEPERTKKYGIRGVPTLVMLDGNDNEVRRMSGNQSQAKLEVFLNGG